MAQEILGDDEGDLLSASLSRWREKYAIKHLDCYIFSPEWEAIEAARWIEYAEIEARRQELALQPLAWHELLKQERIETLQLREHKYRPLEGKLFDICPLSLRLDRFLGQEKNKQDLLYPWRSMLSSWTRFQVLYDSDQIFRSYLSVSQRTSYLLLKDWWTAAYCDPDLPRAAQSFFEEQVDFLDPFNPISSSSFSSTKTSLSLYHSWCYRLFLREFHPQAFQPYLSLVFLFPLQTIRYNVGCHALTQRLSFATLFPADRETQAYAAIVLNGSQTAAESNSDLREYPKFLWDSEQMKTVQVSTLEEPPEYICISHTWGRWRRRDIFAARIPGVPWKVPRNSLFSVTNLPKELAGLGSRYVWIDLFCIPQDGSPEANVEIARQASIFRGCQACIAWLNGVKSWDGMKGALDWLSLKLQKNTTLPSYSASARHRMVTDEDLATAFRGSQVPVELCQRQNNEDEPISWFSSLWTLQEAVLCPSLHLCSRDWTRLTDRWGVPIPLQALMVFLNECHDLCVTDGPIEQAFTDPIIYAKALRDHPNRPRWIKAIDSWPTGARQLDDLRALTRLDNVLVTQLPAVVCTNANVRMYCEKQNRAPAIMSALGVTDWYTRRLSQPGGPEQTQLVMGMYPLEFLQEAHGRFGASFFETSSHSIRMNSESKRHLREGHSMGTMLPFSAKQGWHCGVTGSFEHVSIEVIDHNSVSTWQIRSDGSVRINSAGILLSSVDDGALAVPDTKVSGSVLYAGGSDSYLERATTGSLGLLYTDDLQELISILAKGDGLVYAVTLYEDCYNQHGILLYGLKHRVAASSERYLMKIGSFFADYSTTIETTAVDWVVL